MRTRAFVDPNGRAFASLAAPTPDITSQSFAPTQVVLGGRQDYDPWDRALRSYKPQLVTNGSGSNNYALTATMANTAGLPKSETTYENDHRSRPLFAAAPGEDIATGHTRKTRYRFLNHIAFACDLGLSAQEVGLLMPGISADYRWKRTESEDEDGNISRSYTNALGQQVATASVIQGTTKSITLFNYDDQGNLALVIDPKKQHTTYKYNLLGWMYSKTTVDGGTTKYLYDVSGNVVLEQDATGAAGEPDAYFEVASEPWNGPWYRRYRFDGFGRPVAQERVRADHPAAHGYRGTMVQSWPLDIMSYETREMEVEWPTQLEEWDPWDVSSYTFTSGSTIDRFARIEVMRRVQDEYGSSTDNFVPAMVGMDDILVDPILEDLDLRLGGAIRCRIERDLIPRYETDLAFREHLLGGLAMW
ncbi:MAG: hypothetical protein IPH63_07920 [Flavobacteriales bacterium]|nr:hypothetical protein [Flavobacteriales bacterium]